MSKFVTRPPELFLSTCRKNRFREKMVNPFRASNSFKDKMVSVPNSFVGILFGDR